jgi:hypothetical protein
LDGVSGDLDLDRRELISVQRAVGGLKIIERSFPQNIYIFGKFTIYLFAFYISIETTPLSQPSPLPCSRPPFLVQLLVEPL